MNQDLLHKLLGWLDHNRWLVVSLAFFALIFGGVIGLVGCHSTTMGLLSAAEGEPPAPVTRTEFNRQAITMEKTLALKRVDLDAQVATFNEEVNAFNDQVEAGLEDLEKQDQFRREILDTVGLVATQAAEGSLNPISLIPISIGLLGGALGLGASADNRRKDKVIDTLKKSPSPASGQ